MKNLKKVGKALSKEEQKEVFGGLVIRGPIFGGDCGDFQSNECEISDDCPMKVDPLSGAVFTAICRQYVCNRVCNYSLW